MRSAAWSAYNYVLNDPVGRDDPDGLCPWCAVAYAAFEVGSSVYDAADLLITGVRFLRGRASRRDLAVTAAGAGIGVVGFGGGYGRAARGAFEVLDDLSAAAQVADRGGLTRAGRALTKHAEGQRAGSRAFPCLSGSADEINAAAQNIVDDILTNPQSTATVVTRCRFKGGVDIYDSSGRGVRYDKDKNFVTFLERQ